MPVPADVGMQAFLVVVLAVGEIDLIEEGRIGHVPATGVPGIDAICDIAPDLKVGLVDLIEGVRAELAQFDP